MFEEDVDRRILHFFVGADIDKRFLIVCYRIVDTFGRIYRSFYVCEYFFKFGFNFIYVDVTYNNDTLQVRTIPFGVIIADILIREVVDNVNASDRHTVWIFRIRIHRRLCIGHDTEHAAVTASPFFADYATFFVYFLVSKVDGTRPVVKDKQAWIYYINVFSRHVADIIYRLIDAGICIQVCTEFDTFRFAPRYNAKTCLIPREVFGSIESHVLQEVSQTTLLRFFKDGTYFLCDVEFYSFFRKCIVSNVIGKPVVQFTDADIFVHRQFLHGLCKYELEIAAYKKDCNK